MCSIVKVCCCGCMCFKSTIYEVSNRCFPLFFHLIDPTFIHVHLIPDSAERNDDKLYFFFREKSTEMGQSPVTQSRIGRICLVCTQSGVVLVSLMKRKNCSIEMKSVLSPEASHPLCLNS